MRKKSTSSIHKELITTLKDGTVDEKELIFQSSNDLMMPGMSGWETFDMLRENKSWKDIPIVFLTARTDRVAKNAGQFLGSDYIEKPFEINDLKERIDKALKKATL